MALYGDMYWRSYSAASFPCNNRNIILDIQHASLVKDSRHNETFIMNMYYCTLVSRLLALILLTWDSAMSARSSASSSSFWTFLHLDRWTLAASSYDMIEMVQSLNVWKKASYNYRPNKTISWTCVVVANAVAHAAWSGMAPSWLFSCSCSAPRAETLQLIGNQIYCFL